MELIGFNLGVARHIVIMQGLPEKLMGMDSAQGSCLSNSPKLLATYYVIIETL